MVYEVNGWNGVYACVMRSRSCVDRRSRESLSTDSGSMLGMDAERGDESFV